MSDQQDISFTLARLCDAPTIACLSRNLIEERLPWSWTPRRVAACLRNRQANVLIARTRYRIVGFGIMRYGESEAHLDLLAVAEDYRRLGIGGRLVEWLEKSALVAGIITVFLEVRASNGAAQAFYEHFGYRKLAQLPGYYQRREAAIRMGHDIGDHHGPIAV